MECYPENRITRVVQVSPDQRRSYDSFLLTGLASKSVLLGVRTSYLRGMGKLPVVSACVGRRRHTLAESNELRTSTKRAEPEKRFGTRRSLAANPRDC